MFVACHDLFGKQGAGDGKDLGGSILWQKRCMIGFGISVWAQGSFSNRNRISC